MLHRTIGPGGPASHNRNASNDKFVTKTAIGFSVSALSSVFTSTVDREDLFWSSPDFREKLSSSAHENVLSFSLRRSLMQNPALGVKSSNYYIRFVYIYIFFL